MKPLEDHVPTSFFKKKPGDISPSSVSSPPQRVPQLMGAKEKNMDDPGEDDDIKQSSVAATTTAKDKTTEKRTMSSTTMGEPTENFPDDYNQFSEETDVPETSTEIPTTESW